MTAAPVIVPQLDSATLERTVRFRQPPSLQQLMRVARACAGMKPGEVARAMGISSKTYMRTESGARTFSRAELHLFAALTGQDISFFQVDALIDMALELAATIAANHPAEQPAKPQAA